jgi:L-malate glycosyltransferase
VTRIHQVLSGAGPVDAVTSQAFAYRRAFESWGMAGGVFAAAIEPALRGEVEPVARLKAERGDLLVFHYSAYAPRLEPLLGWPQRKLLVYHNVTPAEWLWEHQPHVATLCALGRDHLPRWARGVDVAAAVSEFNASELRAAGASEVCVVPILLDPARLGMARDGSALSSAPGSALSSGGRFAQSKGGEFAQSSGFGVFGARPSGGRILSVGRLAPHKRPELVLRAFELYRSACDPAARLDMVGEALSPSYERWLRSSAGAGVVIHGRLDQGLLNGLWRDADVFLTLSEHEGFCVPLLEAFASDTRAVARPVGGMPEVGGDAVLWVEDRDLAVVAELVDLAVRNAGLRSSLIARGRSRLADYSAETVLGRLRSAVDAALA